MKNDRLIDLGLTGYEELFMSTEERLNAKKPRVEAIPLAALTPFRNHPFKVKEDEEMAQLMRSIADAGVLSPALARPLPDGGYELISGHRRLAACKALGMGTMPVIIRDLTDEEAVITMVDSNLQREHILPSEKAFSYKMRLDAMKRQAGRPAQENYSPLGNNSLGVKSSDEMAEAVGESKNQIFRFIRLTELIPDLLNMVDEGRIAFRPAVELSYLTKEQQAALLETISYTDATPSLAQAIKMKEFSKNGKLGPDVIESIMSEEKPNQKEKFTFKAERLRQYIPSNIPYEKTEDYVLKALEYYHRYQERQKERSQER